MAKKAISKGPDKPAKPAKAGLKKSSSKSGKGRAAKSLATKPTRKAAPKSQASAKEAIVGLLETPLVAEVLAAGAAAALATMTQQALLKKGDGGTAAALKAAAKAAAAAMGTRLSAELDEIINGGDQPKSGSK